MRRNDKMLVFNSRVKVGDYTFQGVNEITISSSWTTLMDEATIKLPGLQEQLAKDIKIGDEVEIYLGYDGEFNLEFTGYVDKISPDTPLLLECKDEMWRLTRINIPKFVADLANLAIVEKGDALDEIIGNVFARLGNLPFEAPSLDIGDFRINVGSVANTLQSLKDKYSLAIYFREKRLNIRFPYSEIFQGVDADNIIYDLQRNVISTTITDKDLDESKYQLKLSSLSRQLGNTIDIDRGDSNDVQVVLKTYNIKNKQFLGFLADEMFSKLKYNRYESNITTFGIPFIKHSQKVRIIDDKYVVNGRGRREEVYYVDDIETTVSKSGGFRRNITLGRRPGALDLALEQDLF